MYPYTSIPGLIHSSFFCFAATMVKSLKLPKFLKRTLIKWYRLLDTYFVWMVEMNWLSDIILSTGKARPIVVIWRVFIWPHKTSYILSTATVFIWRPSWHTYYINPLYQEAVSISTLFCASSKEVFLCEIFYNDFPPSQNRECKVSNDEYDFVSVKVCHPMFIPKRAITRFSNICSLCGMDGSALLLYWTVRHSFVMLN